MGKIIGILGFIGSGKGTIASEFTNTYNFRQDSFSSSLKDACSVIFDWPRNMLEGDTIESRKWREIVDPWWAEKTGIENLTPRLALQLVGTDSLRNYFHQDIWFLTVQNRMRKNIEQNVVISDVRFPNEIKFIKEQGGYLIKVNRGQLPEWYEYAVSANQGNKVAKDIMEETYSMIHLSEWAWVGTTVDFELDNSGSIAFLKAQTRNIVNKIM